MTQKTCTKCGKDFPPSSFQRDSQKKDGLRSSCKACGKQQKADSYKSGPAKVRYRDDPRKHQPLTAEFLRELLNYDPETGVFTHRVKRNKTTKIGSRAGCVYTKGYRGLAIYRVLYRENRLAWFYVYGVWPSGQVDHINHDRADNRISNLRDVSAAENLKNRRIGYRRRNGKPTASGRTGVKRNHDGWMATITVNGKEIYLGWSKDLQTAISHREKGEAKYLSAASFQPCVDA